MAAMASNPSGQRWQSHADLPINALPSEYRFASSPPVADAMLSWDAQVAGTLSRQVNNDARVSNNIRRKLSGEVNLTRPSSRRKASHAENRPANKSGVTLSQRPVTTHVDRKLSNEERYLKSTVDERVARALNDRKTSNEERGNKFEKERKVPPRLELSRLFTRRKSSKASVPTMSGPTSTSSEYFDIQPLSQQPIPGPHTAQPVSCLRRSKSGEISADTLPSHKIEHEYPKVNVRKPPPGIQHWFDGLGEEYAASAKGHSRESSVEQAKAKWNKTRDTFLSASTGEEELLKKQAAAAVSRALHGVGIPRSPPPSEAPRQPLRRSKTAPGLRPLSAYSDNSVATARREDVKPVPSPRNGPKKHQGLPAAIEDSVLVLSETDESDIEDRDRSANLENYEASIREASLADVVTAKGPLSVRPARNKHSLDKPLPPVRMSAMTEIEDESQIRVEDDAYSARTSLLSDLRTLSFHSHVSQSTLQPSEDWTVDDELSPTNSFGIPEQAIQAYFETNPYEERPTSGRRWDSPTGPTHRLMAVTPEEAALLQAMRRRRAQMHGIPISPSEGRPRTASASRVRSKSQTRAVPAATRVELASPMSPGVSPYSPHHITQTQRERDEDASRIWKDVQQWRHVNSSPDSSERKRTPEQPVAAIESHFSPDTESPIAHFERPGISKVNSNDERIFRLKDAQPMAGPVNNTASSPESQRSKSVDRSSCSTDVERDVLAAWNDLGGWRRSFMHE